MAQVAALPCYKIKDSKSMLNYEDRTCKVLTRQTLVRDNGHFSRRRREIFVRAGLHSHHDIEVFAGVIDEVCILGRYHYLE